MMRSISAPRRASGEGIRLEGEGSGETREESTLIDVEFGGEREGGG